MAGFKRKVFYLGGFDPRGVRFYQRLSAEQLARYADKSGETVIMSKRRSVSPVQSAWTIRNETRDVDTDYNFLRWEDIVSKAWIRNPGRLALRAIRAYRDILRHLDLKAVRGLGSGTLITLFYPPILTILLPLVIMLPILLVGQIFLPWWLALAIGLVAGVFGARPLLVAAHAPWLLRFFVFNSELAGRAEDPAIATRVATFADIVAAALDGDDDEILLVTHSNGSILAMPLMERLLVRRGGTMPANFALVTLGHCIPLIGCRSDAEWFKTHLRAVAEGHFRWIDIGSPPDGAAFFGVNPLLLATPDFTPEITLLSPRFHKFYEPETYHKGWRNKYEIHFDYLRTGDHISPLDFPSIITVPRTIGESVAAFREIA